MKLRWSIVILGILQLTIVVTTSVIFGGIAFMFLIKLLLGVHLHALE